MLFFALKYKFGILKYEMISYNQFLRADLFAATLLQDQLHLLLFGPFFERVHDILI